MFSRLVHTVRCNLSHVVFSQFNRIFLFFWRYKAKNHVDMFSRLVHGVRSNHSRVVIQKAFLCFTKWHKQLYAIRHVEQDVVDVCIHRKVNARLIDYDYQFFQTSCVAIRVMAILFGDHVTHIRLVTWLISCLISDGMWFFLFKSNK